MGALQLLIEVGTGSRVPPGLQWSSHYAQTMLEPIVDLAGFASCVKNAVKIAEGKANAADQFTAVYDELTGKCGDLIFNAVTNAVGTGRGNWSFKQLAVLGLVRNATVLLISGYRGNVRTLDRPVRIFVDKVAEPPPSESSGECPTPEQFLDAYFETNPPLPAGMVRPGSGGVCDNGAAVSNPSAMGQMSYIILIRSGDGWNVVSGPGEVNCDFARTRPRILKFVGDAC